MKYKKKSLAKRFRSYVNTNPTPTNCWLWMGARNDKGYGKFYVNGELKTATHVSWFLATGQWPKDKMCHSCDTPACIRYEHLWEGSHQDNVHDMMQKGRHRVRSGEQHPQAKLTWERVFWIRDQYAKGFLNQYELAEICKVSQTVISGIIRYEIWKLQPVGITSTSNATNTLSW